MDMYQEIFEQRIRLDLKGQPTFQAEVEELTAWFRTKTDEMHPYGDESSKCPLSTFDKTCAGGDAMVPPNSYIYRLSNVGSVFYKNFPKPEYQGRSVVDIFSELETKQLTRSRQWLPLQDYFPPGASLPASRNCTWWTSSPLSSYPTLPSAHKIGMPNGWVKVQSVLLRISCDEFSRPRLKVPSPIDAFDSCIFLAPTLPSASIGRAIDLANNPRFGLGYPEAVATGIPVSIVEILPVRVEGDERSTYPVNLDPLLPSLLEYYKEL